MGQFDAAHTKYSQPRFNSSVGILSVGTIEAFGPSDTESVPFQFLSRNSVRWDYGLIAAVEVELLSFNSSVGILSVGTSEGPETALSQ